MQKQVTGSCVLYDNEGFAHTGKRYVNPDGSYGGWVPVDMSIPVGVHIHSASMILPYAKLTENQIVGPYLIIE